MLHFSSFSFLEYSYKLEFHAQAAILIHAVHHSISQILHVNATSVFGLIPLHLGNFLIFHGSQDEAHAYDPGTLAMETGPC